MRHRTGKRPLGADPRRFEWLCHSPAPAAAAGTGSTRSKPSRSARTSALPPTENATSASAPASVDADRGSRRVRIGRAALRLLDLEQLHAEPTAS